jgi:hypothetical protein
MTLVSQNCAEPCREGCRIDELNFSLAELDESSQEGILEDIFGVGRADALSANESLRSRQKVWVEKWIRGRRRPVAIGKY